MRPPSGLGDDAAAYVDAFAAEFAAELAAEMDQPVDVDAAWARFEETVAPPRRVSSRRWVVGAAVLAAAVAIAWLALPAADTAVPQSRAGHQARDEAVGSSREGTPVAAPVPESARTAPPPELDKPMPDPRPEATPVRSRRRPTPEAETGGPVEPPESGPSRLEEELRLLEAMRASSKAGRHAEALALVRTHAQRFGDGPFAAERELTRVRALCGLGRLEAMRDAKARFATAFPRSHLGSLVRGTCEAPTSKTEAGAED